MSDNFLEVIRGLERLHRHFLDVLRVELRRLGIDDINAVQALMLSNIGEDDMVIRDLKDRGYYQGSNVSYNIKKLVETGYIEQRRNERDRRAVHILLTEKGQTLCKEIVALQENLSEQLGSNGNMAKDFQKTLETLQRIERTFNDFILYK